MFRNAHQPIAKHLFSDAGIWLQNLDSDIMHGEVARSSIGRKRLRFRAFRNEKAV